MKKSVGPNFPACGTCAYWRGEREYKMLSVHFDTEKEGECELGRKTRGLFHDSVMKKPTDHYNACPKWKQHF